jgi:perosamine synthetase
LLFNDPELGARPKHLTTTAKLPHRWKFEHDQLGYNYRLPNLNAALGCAQMEQLPQFLEEKRRLFRRYRDAFASVRGVRLFEAPGHSHSNYWLQTLVIDDALAGARDAVLEATNGAGIMTRPVWSLMSRLPAFAGAPRASLDVAESLERRIVNIPSSAGIA